LWNTRIYYNIRIPFTISERKEMSKSRIPRTKIESRIEERIHSLGGNSLHIYQILAHHPTLLAGWVEFAYCIRKDCQTSRSLREIMILRSAQLVHSDYEWQQHYKMAKDAGVTDEQINHLENWRSSSLFSPQEKLAIELMESILVGKVSDELAARILQVFTKKEYIELVLTGSFYTMVPRVLDCLQVPLEENSAGTPDPRGGVL
jgi:alkylhydroperoxidase family enzyme